MEAAPVTFQADWSWGFLALIGIALMVGVTLTLMMRRLPETGRLMLSLMMSALFLAIGVGLLYCLRNTSQTTVQSPLPPQVVPPQVVPRQVEPVLPATLPDAESLSVALPTVVSADSAAVVAPVTPLPEWTRQGPRVDGQRKLVVVKRSASVANGIASRRVDVQGKLVVVKSGRFVPLDEAEWHAFDAAASVAVAEFRHLDPRGVGQTLDVHRDEIRQSAVRQRFDEVTETDFGKFKAPMHQIWLQVELTPQLGERLAEPWRQAAVEARVHTLAGWGLWLTGVAALTAFTLRLDAARRRRQRPVLCVVAVLLAVGSLVFVA
ncbi:MAG TPA: hypothetical protein VK137_18695 [Planctomycetaceae bacterium]|nr:hypothetical protein [Planctomycetaceae bacterium]